MENFEKIQKAKEHVCKLMLKESSAPAAQMGIEARRRIKNFMERLLAMPMFYGLIRMWQVDVRGVQKCFDPIPLSDVTPLDILDKKGVDSIHGYKEREEVREVLTALGFSTSASGGGTTGWDLGYTLIQCEADRLCKFLFDTYEVEIDVGILKITRYMHTNPHFADLATHQLARQFAKEHNLG